MVLPLCLSTKTFSKTHKTISSAWVRKDRSGMHYTVEPIFFPVSDCLESRNLDCPSCDIYTLSIRNLPPPLPGVCTPQFSRNSRISHRGFAVELSSRLIAEAWPWAAASDSTSGNKQPALEGSGVASEDPTPNQPSSMDAGGKTMLDLVVARAWDRAPTVRQVDSQHSLAFPLFVTLNITPVLF